MMALYAFCLLIAAMLVAYVTHHQRAEKRFRRWVSEIEDGEGK